MGPHRALAARGVVMGTQAGGPGRCEIINAAGRHSVAPVARRVFRRGARWSIAGSPGCAMTVWESLNHHLVMLDRERAGHEASPTAAIIESQSVNNRERRVCEATMPARRSTAASPHTMGDAAGRALVLQAHSATLQDRDGAGPLLRASRARWPLPHRAGSGRDDAVGRHTAFPRGRVETGSRTRVNRRLGPRTPTVPGSKQRD